MKALVTGGAGFIGSHIVDALNQDGAQVYVADDLSTGTLKNLPKQVAFQRLDVRSAEMRTLLLREKPDVIVHAAAQISVRHSMEDPSFDVDVNVRGLVNILQAFAGQNLPYFVFLSTGGALYGEQTKYPAPESHLIAPNSIYGLSKRVGEMYLDFWARELGLKYCVLRLANVYGPRQNPHGEAGVVAIFCEKLLRSEVPVINGSGEQTRDFVFVSDVAAAVRKVVAGKIGGTFNIGTGVETSVNTLAQGIYQGMGHKFKPSYGAAKPGEQMRSSISAKLAKKTFDWKPATKLEEGLRLTAQWFKEGFKGV